MDSENVVRVLDYGEEDGRPYQVLEFLPYSLTDLLAEHGSLGAGQVRRLAADVARGLAAAEAKGIVHRDLSPGNILLGEDGTAKIADYGVARMHELSTMTGGAFLGKPAYASPEHFGGTVDVRSDMYSLGIILHHALAGHLPFEASTPLEMMRHQESTPLPPLPDTVPPELAAIVTRLTQKDPAARFQTPAELLVAIEQTMTPAAGTPRPAEAAPAPDATQVVAPAAPSPAATQVMAPAAPPPDATQVMTPAVAAAAPAAPAVIEPPSDIPIWRRPPILAGIGAAAAILIVAVVVIALTGGGEEPAPVVVATPPPTPAATLAGATPIAAPTPELSKAVAITGDAGGVLTVNDFRPTSRTNCSASRPSRTGTSARRSSCLRASRARTSYWKNSAAASRSPPSCSRQPMGPATP
jgi:serine/threonine-protein kinase